MDLGLRIEPYDTLVVTLRDGVGEATVSVHPAQAGVQSLVRALEAAMDQEYGECFWPGAPGGQYWWIFKRSADTLEVIVMWTRGGATGWEHVFRATDAARWVSDRLTQEIDRLTSQT